MRKALLLFVIVFAAFASKAQVKGIVIDSAAKKPVDKVVVGMVIKSNPTDTIYTLTDEKGQFSFDIVPSSNFSVTIRNMGFQPVSKFIPVSKSEKTINIGAFILTPCQRQCADLTNRQKSLRIFYQEWI